MQNFMFCDASAYAETYSDLMSLIIANSCWLIQKACDFYYFEKMKVLRRSRIWLPAHRKKDRTLAQCSFLNFPNNNFKFPVQPYESAEPILLSYNENTGARRGTLKYSTRLNELKTRSNRSDTDTYQISRTSSRTRVIST